MELRFSSRLPCVVIIFLICIELLDHLRRREIIIENKISEVNYFAWFIGWVIGLLILICPTFLTSLFFSPQFVVVFIFVFLIQRFLHMSDEIQSFLFRMKTLLYYFPLCCWVSPVTMSAVLFPTDFRFSLCEWELAIKLPAFQPWNKGSEFLGMGMGGDIPSPCQSW